MNIKNIKFFVAFVCGFLVMAYVIGNCIENPSLCDRGAQAQSDPFGRGAFAVLFLGSLPSLFTGLTVWAILDGIEQLVTYLCRRRLTTNT